MKNLKFVFAAFFAVLLFSCSQDNLSLEDKVDTIFMQLVQEDVYPFNRLSEASIQHFNKNLVIENGEIVGGDYSEIIKELTEGELHLLFSSLYEEEIFITEDKANIPALQEEILEARGCGWIFLINHAKNAIGDCKYSKKKFCKKCIPLHD